MLEPLDNQNALGFKVARTLVSVHGRKYCPVWNDSDDPITLKYGTPIATVSPIIDIIQSCSDEESRGNGTQQTSEMDPDINRKYIHNLNKLNNNIHKYKSYTDQRTKRINISNTDTGRHFTTNNTQSDARYFYANDARHSYNNDARHYCRIKESKDRRQEYAQDTTTPTTSTLPEAVIHQTIHHKYEDLNLT